MRKIKVAVVLGTKAELIKTIPVIKELERRRIENFFIHTGQHHIENLCSTFEIKKPDIVLYSPPTSSSRFMTKTHKAGIWGLSIMFKIRKVLKKINPDFVLYHGDTLSTAAAAIASSGKKWKNGHIEAGLRSGHLFEPFPEELSRIIADRFSDFLFLPSEYNLKNIQNLKGRSYVTGNTIVDSIKDCLKIARKRNLPRVKGNYVVVNIHRHENIKSRRRMDDICKILEGVTFPIFWPIHDNTKKQLQKFGLWEDLKSKNINFSPLMNYVEFVWLLKNSSYIITDGGSIQEESLVLKKPCLILRKTTERQEGLQSGINFLTELDIDFSKKVIDEIECGKLKIKKFKNPYGDGTASKQIVDILVKK